MTCLTPYIKVLIDINNKELIDLSCVTTRCCSSLHKQYVLALQKRDFERRTISRHKDIHWSRGSTCRTTGLTMLDFFLSVTSIKRFGKYPVIYIQSIHMIKVGTAITRMQAHYKSYDPKSFLFHERRVQKIHICQWALF